MGDVIHRGVKVTIWSDPKFFTLSDDGQLVWFHLFTNPMTNGLGMYHTSIEGLAANKRWDLKRYRKGFGEGLAKGLFEYDETFQVVYFPKFLKHNKPANPNVLKGLLKAWDYIPDTSMKARLHEDLKGLGDGFAKVMANVPLNVTVNVRGNPPPNSNSNSNSNRDSDKTTSSEPGDEKEKPATVMVLPTNKYNTSGETFSVTLDMIPDWKAAYPAVDIGQELLKARSWLQDNPTKRKTIKGMRKFLGSWMSRQQDRGGSGGSLSTRPVQQPGNKTRDRSIEEDLTDTSWAGTG